MLGNSNSSSLEFEPLAFSNMMDVNVFVPEVADGQPAAGYIDDMRCDVTNKINAQPCRNCQMCR